MEYRARRRTRVADYAKIHRLRDENWTIRAISQETGLSETAVWKACQVLATPDVPPDLVRRMQQATGEEQRALMAELHEDYVVSFSQLGEMLDLTPMGAYKRLTRPARSDRGMRQADQARLRKQ